MDALKTGSPQRGGAMPQELWSIDKFWTGLRTRLHERNSNDTVDKIVANMCMLLDHARRYEAEIHTGTGYRGPSLNAKYPLADKDGSVKPRTLWSCQTADSEPRILVGTILAAYAWDSLAEDRQHSLDTLMTAVMRIGSPTGDPPTARIDVTALASDAIRDELIASLNEFLMSSTGDSNEATSTSGYEEQRAELLARSHSLLAPPVGNLVATVYEPRVDGVTYPSAFEELVTAQKSKLRRALASLSPSEGGAVEEVALTAANDLLAEAERYGLAETAALLRSALRRCDGPQQPAPTEHNLPAPPQRVPGPSGKPIGLWR